MTILRDATLDMERGINDVLGDEITYHLNDGFTPSFTFNAWVEFDSADAGTGSSSSRTDAISVEIPDDRVALPVAEHRIEITIIPDINYSMASRRRAPTGAGWILMLKRA